MPAIINIRKLPRAAVFAATVLAFWVIALAMRNTDAAGASALEARVQKLEDESQIRYLLVEYGHLMDTGDRVGTLKLFTKDATWSGRIGTAKGPKAILEMWAKFLGNRPYDPKDVKSFYLMSNALIRVDGDRATALSKWTLFAKSPDSKLYTQVAGHFDDVFVRDGDQWKFQSRGAWRDISPDCWADGAAVPCK
jgi:ketosteroid isomerase-like protein